MMLHRHKLELGVVSLGLALGCNSGSKGSEPPRTAADPAANPQASAAPLASTAPAPETAAPAAAALPPPSGCEPAAAAAPPTPEKPWASLQLPNGTTLTLEAESPQTPIGSLGVAQLRLSRGDASACVAPFIELNELAARAGAHEGTKAELSVVGESSGVVVVRVDVGTQAGEDLQNAFLESSLWAVKAGADDLQLSRLWSGPGGEYHTAFDACLFGVEVAFVLQANGAISRTCKPILTRGDEAQELDACPSAAPAGCAEAVVVPAVLQPQK